MKSGKVSPNFAKSLVVLPMMVCVVMLMVNGNLGTSVAIMGAFGLIRFRSMQGNSRDIAYIFFAMTTGLACSMGRIFFAVGITILIGTLMVLLHKFNYAEKMAMLKSLRITVPEHVDYTTV